MKRVLIISFAALIAVVLAGLAVAVARPQWMPAWARINPRSSRAGPASGQAPADRGRRPVLQGARRPGEVLHALPRGADEDADALQGARQHPRGHLHAVPPRGARRSTTSRCARRGTACPRSSASSAARCPPPRPPCPTTAGAPRTTSPRPSAPSAPRTRGRSAPWRRAERPRCAASPCRRSGSPRPSSSGRSASRRPLVTEETHAHRLIANAETAYDANRYAEISPRVAGFLREVQVDLGQAVRQGEVLAVVDSAEVSAAKTQLPLVARRRSSSPRPPPSGPSR